MCAAELYRRLGGAVPRPWQCFLAMLLLPLTCSLVTPCTQYNSLHTSGQLNCLECTRLYWRKSDADKPDFVMVQDRAGQFFPMTRPAVPLLKKPDGDPDVQTCMWCPETQLCGHPDDYRVICPSPTKAMTKEEEIESGSVEPPPSFAEIDAVMQRRRRRRRKALHSRSRVDAMRLRSLVRAAALEARSQLAASSQDANTEVLNNLQRAYLAKKLTEQAAQGLPKSGGWVDHVHCLDTVMQTRNQYDDEMRSARRDLQSSSPEDTGSFERREAVRSKHSVDTAVRETANLGESDTISDCFGKCVMQGESACSQETQKNMRPAKEDINESVSKTPNMKPSDSPVACSMTVTPGPNGPSGFQVHGRFSRSSKYWFQCHLLPCEMLQIAANEQP